MSLPQQRLGEYVLERPIGSGAFGEVWRARHHAWADQIVAVKIPTDPLYVQSLQKEGFAMQRLSHPCIVKPVSFDPYASPPYLVMEYVPGWSLRRLIQQGPMPIDDAKAVLRQVLAALDHAHRIGIVHRDIKPENILIHERARTEGLSAHGAVKLTDFGLGKTINLSSQSIVFSEDQRDARRLVGSRPYISPEQIDGLEIDAQSDLYSCGVILFEMLTGKRPAGAETPGELNPAVPAELDEIFLHAFARKEKRFKTAEEFFRAFEPAKLTRPLPPAPQSNEWASGRFAFGAILSILAVMFLIAVFTLRSEPSVRIPIIVSSPPQAPMQYTPPPPYWSGAAPPSAPQRNFFAPNGGNPGGGYRQR